MTQAMSQSKPELTASSMQPLRRQEPDTTTETQLANAQQTLYDVLTTFNLLG